MADELVKKVATAINSARYGYEADDDWEPSEDECMVARAALAVMPPVEPTPEMIEAGVGAYIDAARYGRTAEKTAAAIYKAMISSARG